MEKYITLENIISIIAFLNIPMLEWQDKFHRGGTGYIDGIEPEDMTAPIMKGIDNYGRKFVAIRYRKNGGDLRVETIFQRYSKQEDVLVSGGSKSMVQSRMDTAGLTNFKNMVETGETFVHFNGIPEKSAGEDFIVLDRSETDYGVYVDGYDKNVQLKVA